MPQELVLFKRFLVWTGWIVTKPWVEGLVPFELIAHADAMLVEIALVVVVNCLLEQLVALGAVWVKAAARVDRFPFLALDYERLILPTFQRQLLLQADAVLLVGLAMVLGHVLSQRHACFWTARNVA